MTQNILCTLLFIFIILILKCGRTNSTIINSSDKLFHVLSDELLDDLSDKIDNMI
jgi:hypothetical protein